MTNYIHITQSEQWGDFKSLMGTPPVKVGDIQFTKHRMPFTPFYVGYAPRVNFRLQKFNWNELKSIAKSEKCIAIRFDVPNIIKGSIYDSETWYQDLKKKCKKSPKETFARWNVLLDISPSEEKLIMGMHPKTRYNSRLASKKGVNVKVENNEKGVQTLINLMKITSKRQKFLIHSDNYYKKVFELFNSKNQADILIAYLENEPLAAWMLLNDEGILYYPYGGSTETHKNYMPSSLLGWEAIKLGKRKGCHLFDMWGATNDRNDTWWGFTQFKIRYGGELIECMESYDLVINKPIYKTFNSAYGLFWKLRSLISRG